MKTYRHYQRPASLQLAQVCLVWMSLVIPTGVVTLDPRAGAALTGDQFGGPTAEEIDRAVNEAEAQAAAVRPAASISFD